ncbi:ENHANCER OF AG-4 protein 2-like isoform X2 [Hordeum vulgare subsp. vulgare]|uniref:ENHANCER OF AG-4 protein 2-like isoform X2 n=1 Tax=Hordeum vulgare subsp. vulgare TaxID=112509 RepID=UPI001D1A42F4|nr:ENHANCER OF AG-4 protein 2-like isoform X2 [Hordeum vulgare subsp. vulgare]
MAPPARNLNPNPNTNNLDPPFDMGILFGSVPNPTPTTAPMFPAAAGPPPPFGPYPHPSATSPFHSVPYLHHTLDLHPPMPRPTISFPMPRPTISFPFPNINANPSVALRGGYLHYPQDLRYLIPSSVNSYRRNLNLSVNLRAALGRLQDRQSPMASSGNSIHTLNPNTNLYLRANPNAAPHGHYLQNMQDIRHPMPRPVISSAMPNRSDNLCTASGAKTEHNKGAPSRRQNNSNEVVHVSDSDSDSDDFFEEEAPPTHSKSNGKASSNNLKTGGKASSFSNGSKGGKAFSAGKGGKGSTSNAKPAISDAELKLQLDMSPNSRLLTNCEAAEMLQKIHEHMAILSEDPKIKIPESFDKAFQYAKEENHFTSAKLVKEILEPLKDYGVNDGEICMIANIGPETIEEVYALIPSLKATRSINEGKIAEALTALANIKASK